MASDWHIEIVDWFNENMKNKGYKKISSSMSFTIDNYKQRIKIADSIFSENENRTIILEAEDRITRRKTGNVEIGVSYPEFCGIVMLADAYLKEQKLDKIDKVLYVVFKENIEEERLKIVKELARRFPALTYELRIKKENEFKKEISSMPRPLGYGP